MIGVVDAHVFSIIAKRPGLRTSNDFVTPGSHGAYKKDGAPIHLSLEISRVEYEAMIEPYTFDTSTVAMFDDQDKVEVTVFQGEAPDALDNIEIGRFLVEGQRKVPAGNPIVIDFSIDINGILQVRAMFGDDAASSVNVIAGTDIDDAASDAEHLEQRRSMVEAAALVEKAERLLQTVGHRRLSQHCRIVLKSASSPRGICADSYQFRSDSGSWRVPRQFARPSPLLTEPVI
jgi:molecular chaperone DnaK (HSP70)